ncbi:alkaline phosphatase family protein [Candidatus Fermentibacteria bacterium]|nr:alkaline phosphatase family protein [Candidatus Fermentibacteria bacterium]
MAHPLKPFRCGLLRAAMLAALVLCARCGGERGPLLIIGLDAANWDSMDELMAQGQLPNLAEFVRTGTAGELATYVPTASPALWTTIATGQSPDKHGISFRVLKLDERGEHEMLSALSSNERLVPALWNVCTDHGVRSAFVGWWATWPAETIDGYMVTDRVHDAAVEHTAFPPGLREDLAQAGVFDGALPPEQERLIREVRAQFAAWRRGVEEGSVPWRGSVPDVARYLDDLGERISAYRRIMAMDYATERITHYLMDRDRSLRVVAPYFWYLDVCQHLLWKYWRPQDFTLDPEEQRIFAPLVPEYYRFLDGVVGRLCRHRSAPVVILSDHGMESSTAERCINDLFDVEGLLQDMGWLTLKPDGSPDLARSRAYVHAESRQMRLLTVSVVGREPDGTVAAADLEPTAAKLTADLAALQAMPSGEPIFKDVRMLTAHDKSYKAGEFVVYVFAQADVAATINLHAPLSDSLQLGPQCFGLTRWNRWQPGASGQHTEGPPGIVILHGAPFKRGARLVGARLHDIAPTVLAVLGLPVADDLEGKVLSDAFSPRFARQQIPTVPSYGPRVGRRTAESGESGDAAIIEQLRVLGYIR